MRGVASIVRISFSPIHEGIILTHYDKMGVPSLVVSTIVSDIVLILLSVISFLLRLEGPHISTNKTHQH